MLSKTAKVMHNIVYAGGRKSCKPRQHVMFKILLQLGSSPVLAHEKGNVNATIELLAHNCDLEEGSDLFSCEL